MSDPFAPEPVACPRCHSYDTERAMLPDGWTCLEPQCRHTFTGPTPDHHEEFTP